MKKYNLIYNYNSEDNTYTVVCPELFGFILHVANEKDIKKEALRVLKIYTSNTNLKMGNLVVEKELEEEMCI